MKLRSFAVPTLAAALVSLGAFSPAQAAESPTPQITENGYVHFLESSPDPGAKEALDAFRKSDEATQAKYISKLNDPEFFKALFSNNPSQLKAQGLSQDTTRVDARQARAAASGQLSNTYNHKMNWGPIPTLNISQTYTYTTNGSTVTKSDGCVAAYTAFVPIASITENTTHQVKNGHGYCRTDWNAAFLDNASWNFASVQDQEVDGTGKVIFQNFYDI